MLNQNVLNFFNLFCTCLPAIFRHKLFKGNDQVKVTLDLSYGWGNSIRNQCSIMYVRKRINTTYYRYKTEIFLHFQTTIPSVPKLRLLGSRRLYIPRRRTNAWLHEPRWLAQPRWLLTNYYIRYFDTGISVELACLVVKYSQSWFLLRLTWVNVPRFWQSLFNNQALINNKRGSEDRLDTV